MFRSMVAATAQRRLLLAGSGASFLLVTLAHVLFETPGLGIGHLFYLAIALAALASNRTLGAASGLLATGLYCVGVVANPDLPSHDVLTTSTVIRMATYVSSGVLIGWFASSNRALVTRLRDLADRDYLTGLLNVRSFEERLQRRCAGQRRFALLVCDVDGLKELNDRDGHAAGNLLLRRVALALTELAGTGAVAARIGGDEFALLAAVDSEEEAAALCARLELELDRRRMKVSFGWARQPADGRSPTELFRRADERLYRSKATRKSRNTLVSLLAGAASTA
jgi:diguanylate cyclase (GGDEF)-like protein